MSTTSMSIEEEIRTAAGSVPDPEIRKTMAQLGMIDEVELREGGNAIIRYHLTSPLLHQSCLTEPWSCGFQDREHYLPQYESLLRYSWML